MKKFMFVLAIGAFAACNNSGGAEAPKDSTVVKDSTHVTVDSTKMVSDSSAKMSVDTTKKDTTVKK